jgi:hypothetical protein
VRNAVDSGRPEVHLVFMCEGGRHRSVAGELAARLCVKDAFPEIDIKIKKVDHLCGMFHARKACCPLKCKDCYSDCSQYRSSLDVFLNQWYLFREA